MGAVYSSLHCHVVCWKYFPSWRGNWFNIALTFWVFQCLRYFNFKEWRGWYLSYICHWVVNSYWNYVYKLASKCVHQVIIMVSSLCLLYFLNVDEGFWLTCVGDMFPCYDFIFFWQTVSIGHSFMIEFSNFVLYFDRFWNYISPFFYHLYLFLITLFLLFLVIFHYHFTLFSIHNS